jgi:glycosyltransferase involved in cell wall biosynthesis
MRPICSHMLVMESAGNANRGTSLIKVAILGTRGIPARYGGFETFAEQLSTRLVRRGIHVTVFCPTLSTGEDEVYRGVTLKFVKFPNLGKYSEMFWDARCFCVATRHFDVVYMLGLGGAFAAWVPRLFGATVWVNTDGIEWKRTKFTWPQRAYLAVAEALSVLFASRIVADNVAITKYLRKRYPALKHVSTIAYGAESPAKEPDLSVLAEWGLEPDGYYIVVSRLEPENHILEIAKGVEQSSSPLSLVILGSIESPNTYVRKLLAHSSARIRFIGTVYDREKLEALRFYARAYMHGHSVGGTNPSLLEAMACANLVVAHDNPFNREVLGESGLYFASPAELAAIISEVDGDRVNASVRRQKAADIVATRYRWDQVADAYLALLHER